mgnify:FL=1
MSFVFEAKQGSDGSTKASTPKRGTAGYLKYMEKAFCQARSYIRQFEVRPPFILTCDIGSHFELWQDFSGQFAMGYGARERIELEDFRKQEVFDRFVLIFNDPQSLNPEKVRARVTREVAAELAALARGLEGDSLSLLGSKQRDSKADRAGAVGRSANAVANFLMRCIFTMFAEDVGLLPGEVFTRSLRERWIPNPRQFKGEIEGLWETMNAGGRFGFERILRFNGGFFSDCSAFELTKGQLETLCRAADKDWSLVEPAIFGTLLERALDVRERSRLGAHHTPRSPSGNGGCSINDLKASHLRPSPTDIRRSRTSSPISSALSKLNETPETSKAFYLPGNPPATAVSKCSKVSASGS